MCQPRNSKQKKRESGLFFTPVLTLWGSSHIDRHFWRWDTGSTFQFGVIIWHNLHVIITASFTCNNLYVCMIKSMQKKQLALGSWAFSHQTIWTYNSLPLYVAARRLSTTDFPFKFPWLRGRVSSWTKVNCLSMKHPVTTQQNSYSISRLPDTVTGWWQCSHGWRLPAACWLSCQWQCSHRAAKSEQQWLHWILCYAMQCYAEFYAEFYAKHCHCSVTM